MTFAIKNTEHRTLKIFCESREEFKAYCNVFEKLIREGEKRKEDG